LEKAYRADLVFYELHNYQAYTKLMSWRGRIILMNTMAFHFLKQQNISNAVKFAFETQSLVSDLKEKQDVDLLLSANFVTFLILWNLNEIAEALTYMQKNKRII
jgi:hypothetical protein